MIDKDLFIEIIVYILIFLISSTIPIYLFKKFRIEPIVCGLISLGLTILFINAYSFSPLPISGGRTGEFYGIFWVMPPIFVIIITTYLPKRLKKK